MEFYIICRISEQISENILLLADYVSFCGVKFEKIQNPGSCQYSWGVYLHRHDVD